MPRRPCSWPTKGRSPTSSVRYAFSSSGANVLMTDSGPVFQIFQPSTTSATANTASPLPASLAAPAAVQSEQFSATFEGANTVAPVGLEQAATTFNYYVGDSSQWRSNVPAYQQVAYDNLYSGINLVTYGQSDSLKYEFDVAPGANYQQISVHYSGIEGLSIDSQGVLHIQTALGQLTDAAPVIYQNINGQQVAVAGRFQLLDADTYTFVVTGAYDHSQQLVIDPNLTWATYVGGSGVDYGSGIAVNSAGQRVGNRHHVFNGLRRSKQQFPRKQYQFRCLRGRSQQQRRFDLGNLSWRKRQRLR